MISPELVRQYKFFANLDNEEIMALVKQSKEKVLNAGEFFFNENEAVNCLHLVIEGAVAIVMQVPDQTAPQNISGQLMGELVLKDVIISTIGTGDIFGCSSLVPPYQAIASAKALTSPCRVIVFDCVSLRNEGSPKIIYKMTQKAAQILRDRLRDIHIETLAQIA